MILEQNPRRNKRKINILHKMIQKNPKDSTMDSIRKKDTSKGFN